MSWARFVCAATASVSAASASYTATAFAETPRAPTEDSQIMVLPEQVDLEKDTRSLTAVEVPLAAPESPPPPPYSKSLVVDASLGSLVFLSQFGKLSPPAVWVRAQVGVELLRWLMVLGEGELGFSDTSGSQPQPRTRAFPLFGFGGGARFTIRITPRVGAYVQGTLGAMKVDIRSQSLEILGFGKAESLGLYVGGRGGVEWYQRDRHFALGLSVGLRDATGFKKSNGASDLPLAVDGGASVRYAF